jgi:sugar phosphate permease
MLAFSMNDTAPEVVSLKKDRVTNVTLTVICQSFNALSLGGLALLLPLIRQDLGLTFAQAGSLASSATLVYALMQIPAGHLADRFSPKRLFVIGVFGSAALALILGLVQNYWQAMAVQVVSGFFRALLFAPGMALITGWFPTNRRASAMGLYLIGGQTGSVIFNLVGPILVSLGPILVSMAGWRFAFISVAALGIFAALLLGKIGKEPAFLAPRRKSRMLEVFQLFRYKIMWVCSSLQFVRYSITLSITYWLPSLLVSEKGLDLQFTGLIIAMQAVLIAPSNIIGGYISDRLKQPTIVIFISLIVLACTTTLIILVNNIPLLIMLIGLNAIFIQMYFGPLFAIPVEVLGVEKAGISTGFGNMFANLGGLIATYILGTLKDITGGFAAGFHYITGLAIAGLILTLILTRMRSRALSSLSSPESTLNQ